MQKIAGAAMAALFLTVVGGPLAAAQTTDAPVVLQAQPDIGDGVSALPRLEGDTAAIEAINADLNRIDEAVLKGGCDGAGGSGYERGSFQPMTGPAYLSFWIMEGWFCKNTAHPSFEQSAITYDLATGQRVDWETAAPGLGLKHSEIADMPATYVPGLSSLALSTWYSERMLASTDRERVSQCGELWTKEALVDASFKVWLDAENGGLSVEPNFAHVVQACADIATLTAEDMRGFAVSETIIDAVTAAHAAGNWAPRE